MKIGDYIIDFKGLSIDGPMGIQSMEPKIMKLLNVLADNAGRVMTREELISAVWGVEFGGDERLSRGISILRKALGDKRGQHNYIATISRVGYRFIAEVKPHDPVFVSPQAQSNSTQATDAQVNLALAYPETRRILETLPAQTGVFKPRKVFIRNLAVIAALLSACFTLGFLVFSGGKQASTNMTLQAKMERGFSLVDDYTQEGGISEAQDIFSGILSDNPDHAGARAGLAFALFREFTHLERDPALFKRAKSHADTALRKDEHLAIANIAVAWSAVFSGNYDVSHEYLDRADILDPNNILALEGRFGTYRSQGEYKKAVDVLDAAIQTYPNNANFYSARADLLLSEDKKEAAETDFRQSIALAPDNPRTYASLAHSVYSQGRTDDAIKIIQQGLKLNETALLYNNLGTYLFFQGQYGLAVPAFEKTIALAGNSHDYLYWANLGDAYRWSKDRKDEAATSYRRALQLLQPILELRPNSNNLLSRAAMFNAKLGDLDKAQSYIDSVELTADAPSIQLYRAVVTHEILSNRAKALKCLDWALQANYPLIEILNDPELARLRQDPDYHRLLTKTQIQ